MSAKKKTIIIAVIAVPKAFVSRKKEESSHDGDKEKSHRAVH